MTKRTSSGSPETSAPAASSEPAAPSSLSPLQFDIQETGAVEFEESATADGPTPGLVIAADETRDGVKPGRLETLTSFTDRIDIAAAILLHALFDREAPQIKRNDLIILEVPSPGWGAVIADMAASQLLGMLIDGVRDPETEVGDPPLLDKRESNIRVIRGNEPIEQQEKKDGSRLIREVGLELEQGKTVIIVTPSADKFVPALLRRSADHVLVVPGPDHTWLQTFAKVATDDENIPSVEDLDLSQLTPELLRLSARRSQSAADLVVRLRAVLEDAAISANPEGLALGDLHGMDDVVAWGRSLAIDLAQYMSGNLNWSDIDRGALLWGAPGTGKTTVARALARHCKVPFFSTSYTQWQREGDGHLGTVLNAMSNSFEEARKAAPAILFIDELDTVNARDNNSYHRDWWRAIVNALLEQLDGVVAREGVVVIGATNYPRAIDAAIRRAGRLDREIEIKLPDAKALAKIFDVFLRGALAQTDLERLASIAVGHTGADVAGWVRGARRRARMARREVTFADVFGEIAGNIPDRASPLNRRVAIHEAGHAVINMLESPDAPPPTVAMGADFTGQGATSFELDRSTVVTGELIDRSLRMLFGGRAAEEVILGQPTGGAGGSLNSDLAKATRLAIAAEVNLGLGSTGLIWGNFDDPDKIETILATRPATEQAVRRRLDAAYAGAKGLISQHRTTVEALADALLDRVVLTPTQTADIFKRTTSGERVKQNVQKETGPHDSSEPEVGKNQWQSSA